MSHFCMITYESERYLIIQLASSLASDWHCNYMQYTYIHVCVHANKILCGRMHVHRAAVRIVVALRRLVTNQRLSLRTANHRIARACSIVHSSHSLRFRRIQQTCFC